jgi:anti-sigma regulatory factor (Ser/Thr protein kinase)
LGAHYRPARAVGGDFYDFIPLPDGQLGLVIGDVADKGVPAALIMAATRSTVRASARRLVDPAAVLARVNELVVTDTPPHIYVTCLYAVLEPASGRLRYANAGHDPPYVHTAAGEAVALQARGMPLGIMAGYTYDSHEAWLRPGEHVLLYSDGLVEAHNPQREMFSFERLKQLMASYSAGATELIDTLLGELDRFVGQGWEQEDDVTLVSLKRKPVGGLLADFTVERRLSNERATIARVVEAIEGLGLESDRLERLKTAVAEATINAVEHADRARPEQPVFVRVLASDTLVTVAISNPATGRFGRIEAVAPDLLAKLEGREEARGWGLFLMKQLADDLSVISEDDQYTVELSFRLPGRRPESSGDGVC